MLFVAILAAVVFVAGNATAQPRPFPLPAQQPTGSQQATTIKDCEPTIPGCLSALDKLFAQRLFELPTEQKPKPATEKQEQPPTQQEQPAEQPEQKPQTQQQEPQTEPQEHPTEQQPETSDTELQRERQQLMKEIDNSIRQRVAEEARRRAMSEASRVGPLKRAGARLFMRTTPERIALNIASQSAAQIGGYPIHPRAVDQFISGFAKQSAESSGGFAKISIDRRTGDVSLVSPDTGKPLPLPGTVIEHGFVNYRGRYQFTEEALDAIIKWRKAGKILTGR